MVNKDIKRKEYQRKFMLKRRLKSIGKEQAKKLITDNHNRLMEQIEMFEEIYQEEY